MPSWTPVVKIIVLANAAVFLLTFLVFLVSPEAWGGRFGIANLFGLQPDLWRQWAPLFPIWQLLSWGFLHDVTHLTHILFNMLALYFFGTMLEGILGGRRFMVLYGSALIVTGAVTLLVGISTGSSVNTIGASGGILAVIVAAATLRPRASVIFIIFPLTLRTLALVIVGMDVFNLLLQASSAGAPGNVAYLAHVTGAAWGFLGARQRWIFSDPIESLRTWSSERSERQQVEENADVDRVLEKIQKQGIGALTTSERAALKRASKKR